MKCEFIDYYISNIGRVEIVANSEAVIRIAFVDCEVLKNPNNITEACKIELEKYFNGVLREFTVKIAFNKGTDFQKKVWFELLKIPYGDTVSYSDIAKRIGNEKAVRAIGGANNKNPISIIVPCHRVIGKNGKLVGYESGIDKKDYLIALEKGKLQK